MEPIKVILQKTATTPFYIKKGDTAPSLKVQVLTDAKTPLYLYEDNETVFQMALSNTSESEIYISGTANVFHSGLAILEYNWKPGDTNVSGTYNAEFKIKNNGNVLTVPSVNFLKVIITESLP